MDFFLLSLFLRFSEDRDEILEELFIWRRNIEKTRSEEERAKGNVPSCFLCNTTLVLVWKRVTQSPCHTHVLLSNPGIEQLMLDETEDDSSKLLLTMADLTKGLNEIEPAHQNPEDQLKELMHYGMLDKHILLLIQFL